jgi:hypothetical protein
MLSNFTLALLLVLSITDFSTSTPSKCSRSKENPKDSNDQLKHGQKFEEKIPKNLKSSSILKNLEMERSKIEETNFKTNKTLRNVT